MTKTTIEIKDTVTLDAGGLTITKDGYLVGDAKVSRAGNVQYYIGSEIGLTGVEAELVVGVYRDPDAVFDTDSMLSLAGRPVTRGHPPEGVSADSWKDLAVGQMGGVVKRDGEHVVAPMAIMDVEAVKEVQAGARALSAGYSCRIVADEGVNDEGHAYQYRQAGPIRFNHVAYLPDNNPRAGNTRIGDTWGAVPIEGFTTGGKPTKKGGRKMGDNLKTVVIGDNAVRVAVEDAAAIEKFKTEAIMAQEAHASEIAAKDEQIGKLTAELKEAKDAAEKIDIDSLVKARSEILSVVKAIDSNIETSGKSDAEIRKAVVAAKLGDEMVKDASDDTIKGMFAVVAKSADTNPAKDVISGKIADANKDVTDAREAYLSRVFYGNKKGE